MGGFFIKNIIFFGGGGGGGGVNRNNLQPYSTLFQSTLGIILKLNTVRKHLQKKNIRYLEAREKAAV